MGIALLGKHIEIGTSALPKSGETCSRERGSTEEKTEKESPIH